MLLSVLGPLALERDGEPVELGTPRQRALLAALALHRGQVVPVDVLADLVWGERPPPSATGTLQAYVAGLRRVLEPQRAARAVPQLLVTSGSGYVLRVPPEALDATCVEQAITRAGVLLGHLVTDLHAPTDGVPVAEARTLLGDACARWRGVPYAELGDAAAAVAERARLEELRATGEELRSLVRLAEGDAAGAAAELERLTRVHPLRERLWALRALALARTGRQADALAALREVRRVLADELGLDPGSELRQLEAAVLRQDPVLERRSAVTAAAAPQGEPGPERPAPRSSPWPFVGRGPALERLVQLLERAGTGEPQAAVLVGEPGIGKSRLCAELASVALGRGAQVRIGRCSQDDGAPPLWPWASVLDGWPSAPDLSALAAAPVDGAPAADGADTGDVRGRGFRTRDAICRAVVEAARATTTVVVLDDLHWSDASSLRVLQHLLDVAHAGRLLVVVTWRSHPPPTGRLAEVAEALARRHALRLDLHGLSTEATAELLSAVVGSTPAAELPTGEVAAALRRRTDGNPFFLVELARLLAQSGDPRDGYARALAAEPPAAVADVLRRRLAVLPDSATAVLQCAAVLGRAFALDVLVAVTELPEPAVLDALDAALATGLVVEEGVDRFSFAHALVRDAVLAPLGMSRRARLHARAGAVLQARPDAERTRTESARHWLAAGPAHAARAWTSAVDAARAAAAVHAHEEVRELLRAALAAQAQDPTGSWTDRYDLLLALVDASRLIADWDDLTEVVDRAVEVAEAHGDAERAAAAAVQPSFGALWQPRPVGTVHRRGTAALRRSLEWLPAGDGPLRCRVLCALAVELYYASAPLEREALTDEALAMARRLGDPDLLQLALQATFTANWRPATAERRLALATEGVALAEQVGDDRARATSLTLQVVALGELGRVERMHAVCGEARALARRLRMAYLLIVLGCTSAPWLAMRGDDDEATAVVREIEAVGENATLPHADDGIQAVRLVVRVHQGDVAGVLAGMQQMAGRSALPLTSVVCLLLLRAGLVEEAGSYLDGAGLDLDRDDWFSLLTWCAAGEVAAGLGRAELGAAAYARALPYAGRPATAGSSGPLGPVDAFLALAAVATGERATATKHADDAERLCAQWQVPRAAQWVRDLRDRHGI